MGHFYPGKFLTQSESRARHLFGDFYDISVRLEEVDGAPDGYWGAPILQGDTRLMELATFGAED